MRDDTTSFSSYYAATAKETITISFDKRQYFYFEYYLVATTLGGATVTKTGVVTMCGQEQLQLASENQTAVANLTYVMGDDEAIIQDYVSNFSSWFKMIPY